MGQLLSLLWDICRLRRGPQDLPHSPQLLLIVCAFILGLQLLAAQLSGMDGGTLASGVLSLVFNFGVLYTLLSLRGMSARFIQTALALICCALFFSVMSLLIALVFGAPPQSPEQMTPQQLVLVMVALSILVWKVVVDGHILRHSLNVPFIVGFAIAVLWLIAEVALGAAAGGAAAT